MSNTPNQSSPASNALFVVIFSLSFGIGIPFARLAGPLLCPGLDDTWGVRTVNLVSTAIAFGIVSLVLSVAVKLFRKREAGGLWRQKPPAE
ncbi:MAG TPA: hypothetical protein VE988_02515 [Gemmataceae bacterium]|nr:hypothetical protein [Gemmataceae bacterium]